MNYFNPYPPHVVESATSAWESQLAQAAKTPPLAELLAQRGHELFPRFVAAYAELRALPRGGRRALQRRLAHSREIFNSLQDRFQQRPARAVQQRLACTLAGAALLLVLGRGVSDAAPITVTTTVPGVIADGQCSITEAILNANANAQVSNTDCPAGDADPTEDHIVLPTKKKITLSAPYGAPYNYLYVGLPVITGAVTIEGNGSTIARKKGTTAFGLMAVSTTGDLELQDVTLSGGSSYTGGAIVNFGELTVTDSTITGNQANFGGGIYNYNEATITNSTIAKNSTKGYLSGLQYYGGFAGGIANASAGTLTVTNSTITGNKAFYSAGIGNIGNMEINNSTVSRNASVYTGGIGNYAGSALTQTISNSTISGNTAKLRTIKYGGYTYFAGGVGGGITNYNSTLTISNSTISGNKAVGKRFRTNPYFAGGLGGGIFNVYTGTANLTLTNGSVTGNTATSYGGGLFNFYGNYTYTPGTITGNKAKFYADIFTYP